MNKKTTQISPTDNLTKLKEELIKKREQLKEDLQSRYPEVYNYLVERGVDLNNLQKYSKQIAAALVIAQQVASITPSPVPVPTPPKTEEVKTDNSPAEPPQPVQDAVQDTWDKYGKFIKESAKKYELDPRLIFATIMTETDGDPNAYRYEPHLGDASYGLGQLLYTTAQALGFSGKPEELYDPATNIDLIGRYYKRTLEDYGNLTIEQLVRAYNAGSPYSIPHPGHLQRFWEWYNQFPQKQIAAVK